MEEAQCNERPKMNVYKNDYEYVWLTLSNYEDLKERMKRLEDELYFINHTNVAKISVKGFFSAPTIIEFHPSDKTVEMINEKLMKENEAFDKWTKEHTSKMGLLNDENDRLKAKINRLEWWKFWK